MSKIAKIAWTEYCNYVRSKGFLIGIILLPVLMFGSVGIQYLTRDKADVSDRRLVVVDRSGRLLPGLLEAAKMRNESVFAPGNTNRQLRARYFLESLPLESAGDRPEVELSRRVERGEIFAFLLIPAGFPGSTNESLHYFTRTPTYVELPEWIEEVANREVRRLRALEAGLDPARLAEISRPVPVTRMGLVRVRPDGEVQEPRRENPLATFGIPLGFMMLLFLLIMTSTPALLNAVLEEKMQKIAELLISAVPPFQLMLGKLAGLILVSLTLSGLYLSAAAFAAHRFAALDLVPPSLFAWFLLFQVLGMLIYGSLFLAIGAACTEMKDAQNLMGPATLILVLPMFTLVPVLQSPNSSFSTGLSLFPPSTPLILFLRIAVPPGPPGWQIALGLALVILFAMFSLWAAGRIFRIGLLAQGEPPTFGRLVRWVFGKL